MPTRPKGIESAAIERRVVVHIRTDGHSVGCGKWTAKAVRGARMRERGASLLTRAAFLTRRTTRTGTRDNGISMLIHSWLT